MFNNNLYGIIFQYRLSVLKIKIMFIIRIMNLNYTLCNINYNIHLNFMFNCRFQSVHKNVIPLNFKLIEVFVK